MSARTIVIKNISANALLQVVTVIGGFILPPLIVSTYGSTVNGMVASARQFINYLVLLEAGVGAAGLVALYPALAKQDHPLRNRILASIHHFYRISGSLFAVGLVVLAIVYGWITRHQISPELTFWMVIVLGSVNVIDFFFFGTYRILLTADQRNYVISVVNAVFSVVYVAAAYWLIKQGHSILDVQILATSLTAFKFILFNIYIRRHYGQINIQYDRKQPYKLEQNWDVMVHMIGGLVVFSSPLVLITLFLTLKDASIYAVYALVFNGVSQGLQVLSRGITPVFGHSLNTDKTQVLRQFRRFELMFFCVLGWAYTCTALLVMPFISVYTRNMHDANYYQPLLAGLFVVSGVLMSMRIPASLMREAAGHFKQTKLLSLYETTINLIFSVIFVYFFGLNGILLGSVVSFLYSSYIIISYSCKNVLQISVRKSYGLVVCFSLLMLLYIYCMHYSCVSDKAIRNYWDWLQHAMTIATLSAIFYLFIWKVVQKISAKI